MAAVQEDDISHNECYIHKQPAKAGGKGKRRKTIMGYIFLLSLGFLTSHRNTTATELTVLEYFF